MTLRILKGPKFTLEFTPQATSLQHSPSFNYELYVSKYLIQKKQIFF